VRVGCVTAFENAARAAELGFDYIEPPVGTLKPAEPNAVFASIRGAFASSPLPAPCFNLFIPAELKITGPAVDEAALRAYARTAVERVAAVGGRVIVLGSGPARTIPGGFARERGEEQFAAFARFVGDVAQRVGVIIAFESIARGGGVNLINTFAEAVAMAARVGHPAVRAMADLGQMAPENEPWENLRHSGAGIAHVHLTDTDKKVPGRGALPWKQAFAELRGAGYDGPMSIECKWSDLEPVAAEAVRFVRETWEATR
jgi:sugar phosphate isomerase/epimerase